MRIWIELLLYLLELTFLVVGLYRAWRGREGFGGWYAAAAMAYAAFLAVVLR